MFIEIVEFDRPEGFSDDDLLEDGRSTIPRWKGFKGLIRKHFVTDGPKVLGVYVWETRDAAEEGHNAAWIEAFTKRTGVPPKLRLYNMFMEIDNAAGEVREYPME
ncbi:hypothetical protein [Aestuariivita boseongensis]|uniref:hypothetical protein n=1 Tax=Aestuariivita boseongensis TaxID=1470562 RepID=UPI000680B540|nr:hypothetical protein [Aestuariivita boseongensis]